MLVSVNVSVFLVFIKFSSLCTHNLNQKIVGFAAFYLGLDVGFASLWGYPSLLYRLNFGF